MPRITPQSILCLSVCLSGLFLAASSSLAASAADASISSTQEAAKPKAVPHKSAHAKVSEAQALKMIDRRPEVKSWKAQIVASKTKGVTPHVALDRKEAGEYVVHVYEDVPDDDGSSHTATMNWYYVSERTGKVRTEF